MTLRENIRYTILLCFLSALIGVWAVYPSYAESAEQAHITKMIGIMQKEADNYRASAEDRRKKLKQYQALADNAKQQLEKSTQKTDKESWASSYQTYSKNVEEYRKVAKEQDAKAEKAEARVAELKQELKELQQADARQTLQNEAFEARQQERREQQALDDATQVSRPKLRSIVGVWQMKGTEDEPMVIVQSDPESDAYQNRLEIHTNQRVWKGHYYRSSNDGKSMIEAEYTPEADEMNPEMPKWVRQNIEGKLTWKLEIDAAATCGKPSLTASFYPGRVRWQEESNDPEQIWLEGEGKARRYALKAIPPDISAYSYGAPQLLLRLPGKFNYLKHDVIEGLTKRQKFFVDVVVPPDMADQYGETIKVNIKNKDDGDSTTLQLKRGAKRIGRSVRYSHYEPITIADAGDSRETDKDPPFLSMNYMLGVSGARIDLDAENGELIEFSFEDAKQSVPVYNSWVQRKIARHQLGKERLRIVSAAIVGDSKLPNAMREQATMRLNMIKNYETLLASDALHDYIRAKLGDLYFESSGGIVNMSRSQMAAHADKVNYTAVWAGKLDGDAMDGSKMSKPEIYKGVVWVDGYERDMVLYTVNAARDDYRDVALETLPKAIAYGLYSAVVTTTGAADSYTMWYGKDIFGKKVQGWERAMAAVGAFSGNLASYSAPSLKLTNKAQQKLFSPGHAGESAIRVGEVRKILAKQAGVKLKTKVTLKDPATMQGAIAPEKMPKSLNAKQRKQAMIDIDEAPETLSSKPMDCAFASEKPLKSGKAKLPENADGPPDRPAPIDEEMLEIAASYGAETKALNPGEGAILPPQEFGTCQCSSTMRSILEKLKTAFSEMMVFGTLLKKGAVTPDMDLPLVHGYNDKQLSAWLQSVGAEVNVLPIGKTGKRLTPEQLEHWRERGWFVRDTISPKNMDGEHAIEFRGVERNADGEVSHVKWFDSAYGKELITTRCNYVDNLVTAGHDVIMWRWNDPPSAAPKAKPTIEYPKGKAQPTIEYPAGKKRPTIEYPEQKAKPTIEYPAKKGDASEARLKSSRNEVDEVTSLDDLDGDPLSAFEINSLDDLDVKPIEEFINEAYPNNDAPPIHATDDKGLAGITRSGHLRQPRKGGASFSPPGVGVVREGTQALRVNPELQHFIEMRKHPAGLVPIYWPSGKIGEGKYWTYVPTKYLQRFEKSTGRWVDFPQKK